MRLLTKYTITGFMIAGFLAMFPSLGQTIATTAGTGSPGLSGDNGLAISAQIDTVYGVTVDARGNTYFADSRNHCVRKIANGMITTVAGTGKENFSGDGGLATAAQLSFPRDVAVDANLNLYIADTGNCRIRKVTAAGVISTVAGNGTAGFAGDGAAAASAQLNYPAGLATDSAGNLFVADSWNYRIRKITTDGKIQTIVGNGSYGPFGDGGPAITASLGLIQSLAVDAQGNLYLSDAYNHLVRKVAAKDSSISTVVGGGFGAAVDGGAAQTANLKFPKGIAVDLQGNLFISDSLNHRIRKISSGVISTVAGSGTPGYMGDTRAPAAAQLNSPAGLSVDSNGVLVFSDLWNYRVRSVGMTPVAPTIVSISNTASGQPSIAPGGFASIYGANFAPRTVDWSAAIAANHQLPSEIDSVSVWVAGQPAYVQYVSSNQINFVAPTVSAGSVPVVVKNAGITSASFNTTAQLYSPAFFLWGQYAVATHTDYSMCVKTGQIPGATTIPAKPGEWITLWGTGFGPTDVPVGALTPAGGVHSSVPVTVTVGGVNALVYGGAAALAPGFAGLYQIAVQIPASMQNGDVPVKATVGGVQSADSVLITVLR